jgi:hypothetical protein
VSGDVTAETTNGDIVIENAQTTSMEVSTVNGDIAFNGTIRDSGTYRLGTHSGDLRVGLGGVANATVFVRTFQGDFAADFPIQLPEGQTARSGSKRFNFTLGSGSARIELQSFNGDIVVARQTALTQEEARRLRRGQAPRAPEPPRPPDVPKPPKPPGVPDGLFFDHDLDIDLDFDFDVLTDIDHDIDLDAGLHVDALAPLPQPSPAPTPFALTPPAPPPAPAPLPRPSPRRRPR